MGDYNIAYIMLVQQILMSLNLLLCGAGNLITDLKS